MNIVSEYLNELEKETFTVFPTDEFDLYFQLELYKLISRDILVERLSQYNLMEITSVERSTDFGQLEDKYNILIDTQYNKGSSRVLRVIYPLSGTTPDITALSISLNQYELEFCCVTKLNFLELSNIDISTYYDINCLMRRIIIEAVQLKATDIHFSVEHTDDIVQYPIYYRSGGHLVKLDLFTLTGELNSSIIRQFVEKNTNSSSLDITDSAGVIANVSNMFKSRIIEIRVSANAVVDGLRCVMRIQEKTTTSLLIEQLGFDSRVCEGIKTLANRHNGITLITGAIRTGKNTTAFAIANEMLSKGPINLISYDSPVEVLMPFAQVDYREDPKKLLDCIRLAKKQDIDTAFLNEIPSKDVAFAVKDLVNSSIGVITTIHLDRLWDLPFRLYEYYGDNYKDIITHINGVVNQKMFGVLCDECKVLTKVSELPEPELRNILLNYDIDSVYVNKGCQHCYDIRTQHSGYQLGKNQPYAEFLVFTDEVKSALLKQNSTWEMSAYLKEYLLREQQNLEVFMIDAISAGKLSYQALSYVL